MAHQPDEWDVKIHFTKGVLSGQRGVVVTVTHQPSGRRLKTSLTARTKRDARQKGEEAARDLIARLKGDG